MEACQLAGEHPKSGMQGQRAKKGQMTISPFPQWQALSITFAVIAIDILVEEVIIDKFASQRCCQPLHPVVMRKTLVSLPDLVSPCILSFEGTPCYVFKVLSAPVSCSYEEDPAVFSMSCQPLYPDVRRKTLLSPPGLVSLELVQAPQPQHLLLVTPYLINISGVKLF